jgi:hypothetical protein
MSRLFVPFNTVHATVSILRFFLKIERTYIHRVTAGCVDYMQHISVCIILLDIRFSVRFLVLNLALWFSAGPAF